MQTIPPLEDSPCAYAADHTFLWWQHGSFPAGGTRAPILYQLVYEVVQAVGRDVIRVPIVDHGFIDGAQMGRLQQDYRIETILPAHIPSNSPPLTITVRGAYSR